MRSVEYKKGMYVHHRNRGLSLFCVDLQGGVTKQLYVKEVVNPIGIKKPVYVEDVEPFWIQPGDSVPYGKNKWAKVVEIRWDKKYIVILDTPQGNTISISLSSTVKFKFRQELVLGEL